MRRSAPREVDVPTVEEIQGGLSISSFQELRNLLGVTEATLGRHLSISPATLYRRLASGRFTVQESDRLAQLTRLYAKAVEVLGDHDSARDWFLAPNASLANKRPFDLADTDPGCVEVERLLGRIEYGVF